MIHPFLLAIVPILAISVHNTEELSLGEIVLPITVAFLLTLAIWLLATYLLGSRLVAGLFTSLFLIPLYSGRQMPEITDEILQYLSGFWVRTEIHVAQRVFTLSALLVLGLVAFLLLGRLKKPAPWTRRLNVFSIILVILLLTELIHAKPRLVPQPQRSATVFPLVPQSRPLPDIYYIILDGYARSDVLLELFDFDNGPFLDRLEHKGFYVARESTSNYCQTPLSLSSSLNLQYLDDLVKGLGTSQTELHEVIERNNLVATLRRVGYQFITFATGFDPTDLSGSDRYVSPHLHLTELQRLLIDRTVLWAFLPETDSRDLFTQARERTLFLIDQLPQIAADPHPTFTLAHILCPHPPFVFGPAGEDISHRDDHYYLGDGNKFNGMAIKPEIYVNGYRGQVNFITRRIEDVIDQILARSKVAAHRDLAIRSRIWSAAEHAKQRKDRSPPSA